MGEEKQQQQIMTTNKSKMQETLQSIFLLQ